MSNLIDRKLGDRGRIVLDESGYLSIEDGRDGRVSFWDGDDLETILKVLKAAVAIKEAK